MEKILYTCELPNQDTLRLILHTENFEKSAEFLIDISPYVEIFKDKIKE